MFFGMDRPTPAAAKTPCWSQIVDNATAIRERIQPNRQRVQPAAVDHPRRHPVALDKVMPKASMPMIMAARIQWNHLLTLPQLRGRVPNHVLHSLLGSVGAPFQLPKRRSLIALRHVRGDLNRSKNN
jgi:hypothetical protein